MTDKFVRIMKSADDLKMVENSSKISNNRLKILIFCVYILKNHNNLIKNREILVHYLFKAKNVLPAFRLYAEADLYSNRCRYKEKEVVQGDTPFDFYLDDTVFEIWNEPYSTYSYNSFVRLRCGGINRENAKKNWVIVSNFCKNLIK